MMWEQAYEQAVLREEAELRRKRRGWRKLQRQDDVVIGSIYGSADGMVKVQDKTTRGQILWKGSSTHSHRNQQGRCICL